MLDILILQYTKPKLNIITKVILMNLLRFLKLQTLLLAKFCILEKPCYWLLYLDIHCFIWGNFHFNETSRLMLFCGFLSVIISDVAINARYFNLVINTTEIEY